MPIAFMEPPVSLPSKCSATVIAAAARSDVRPYGQLRLISADASGAYPGSPAAAGECRSS